jgi:hypothetical protein
LTSTQEPHKSAPTDAAIDKELERELCEAEQKQERTSLAELLNKPFTLWILSTFLIGIFSFIYSNYTACQTQRAADNARLLQFAQEVIGREEGLMTLFLTNGLTTNEDKVALMQQLAKRWVNSKDNFVMAEFKDYSPEALKNAIELLMAKWDMSSTPAHATALDGMARALAAGWKAAKAIMILSSPDSQAVLKKENLELQANMLSEEMAEFNSYGLFPGLNTIPPSVCYSYAVVPH